MNIHKPKLFFLLILLCSILITTTYRTPLSYAATSDGTWSSLPNMPSSHLWASGIITLNNNNVLVTAGYSPTGLTASTALFNTQTKTWSTTGNINDPRALHGNAIVKLNDGTIMIAGGEGPDVTDISSVEIYNPASGTWQFTDPLATPRRYQAIILQDGKVLVTAGAEGLPDNDRFLGSTEIYNPQTEQWTSSGYLKIPREGAPEITLLPNGKVLLLGGYSKNDRLIDRAEIYDPQRSGWTTSLMPYGLMGATATVLDNGLVLIAGGSTGYYTNATTITNKTLLYNPTADTWTPTTPMNVARSSHNAVLLEDGKVLIIGGGTPITEIYDPQTSTWKQGPSTKYPQHNGIAVLQNKDILAIAGDPQGVNAEIFTDSNSITPSISPSPIPSPTPTPSRNVTIIHGIKTSTLAFQNGTAGFKTLIDSFQNDPEITTTFFSYYQDLEYENGNSCNPQPTPDTDTDPLHNHPESINPDICDSQSAIAYNSTKLYDQLTDQSLPTTIINYSMGAPITRGWLTLAQNKPGDTTLKLVDTIISIQGAQQGSYIALGPKSILNLTGWDSLLFSTAVTFFKQLTNWDISRPAIQDLAPQSDWYKSANFTSIPSKIKYFNFLSDIKINIHPQIGFATLPAISSPSLGDTILFTGDPNPTSLPLLGGARFKPNNGHEYILSNIHEILLGNDLLKPSIINNITDLKILKDTSQDNISHFNLSDQLTNNDILVDSCKSSIGRTTIQNEILRIIKNPDQACDL